jgi:adenylosuccinate lyase
MTMWMQDFALDAEELLHRIVTLRFRGVKGTTGTQASFSSCSKAIMRRWPSSTRGFRAR